LASRSNIATPRIIIIHFHARRSRAIAANDVTRPGEPTRALDVDIGDPLPDAATIWAALSAGFSLLASK
jgi:hypothetical protein